MEVRDISNRLVPIRNIITTKVAELGILIKRRDTIEERIEELKTLLDDAGIARALIQEVAKRTQENMEKHVSGIVTLALDSVLTNPPEFVMKYEIRRNQTECDLFFIKNGHKYFRESGGGMDLTSFGLQVASWTINKTRACIVLDEPFKYVSPDLSEKVGAMLSQVSKKLGLQIIIISHSEDVNLSADKTFMVTINKQEVSSVEELV